MQKTIRPRGMCLLALSFVFAACNSGDQADTAAEADAGAAAETEAVAEATPPADMANPIVGSSWNWVGFDGMDDSAVSVPTPANYTLSFAADGTASVKADCNNGHGSYTVDGSSLQIGPVAITKMMCPEGSLDNQYLGYLEYVRSYMIDGGMLHLSLMADGGIMHFEPAGMAE